MDKLKIKEEIKALYDDTEKCISNLVVSRGKRDEQGIADAHWHMESLMVNAQQMCSVILDSLQEEPSIPDIVDEHFDEMLGEEPVSKVWHTTMEEPNSEDSIVIVYDNGCTVEPSFKDFKSYSEWKTIKQSYRVKLWAYLDDLLSLSTAERNGKNLKELKTMLDDSLAKMTKEDWNEFLDDESKDLEEEIDRWSKEQFYNDSEKRVFAVVARHFANWQRSKDIKRYFEERKRIDKAYRRGIDMGKIDIKED